MVIVKESRNLVEKNLSSLFFYLAPIFLTLALILAHQLQNSYDLYFVVPISLIFLSISPKKGFFISSFLLIASSLLTYFFFPFPLFFRFGLDSSILLSFFLLWQVEEARREREEELKTFLQTKESFISHLEKELELQKEEELQHKISFTLKMEDLQKNIEEIEKEKGALEILNDVLRTNQKEAFLQEKELVEELVHLKIVLDEFSLLYQKVEEEKEEISSVMGEAFSLIDHLSQDFLEKEEELEVQEAVIAKLFKEPSTAHLSTNLREAFSPKAKALAPKGPSLEETLREALLSKKKKK